MHVFNDDTVERIRRLLDEKIGRGVLDVLPGEVIDRGGLLILFVNSPEYVRFRDERKSIIGYGPLLLEKESGRVFLAGSSVGVDELLMEYVTGRMRGVFELGTIGSSV